MIQLNEFVPGLEGDPEPDNQQLKVLFFDQPVEVTYFLNGTRKTAKFKAGVPDGKKLTYRMLLLRSIRTAGQADKDVPDVDRRTELIQLLFADSADLDDEARGDIIKCVRAMGDPLYLMRIKELFESAYGRGKNSKKEKKK